MVTEWECTDCGYLVEGERPPGRCPDCDATTWEKVEYAEEWGDDDSEEGKQEVKEVDTEWECMDCGYLHEGKQPPRRCPDCGAVGAWEKVEYVDDWEDSDEDSDEEEEE